jgi:hypothetical protein
LGFGIIMVKNGVNFIMPGKDNENQLGCLQFPPEVKVVHMRDNKENIL